MIQIIAKVLKVLNSESEPGQISLALCFSMIIGLTPLYSPHNLLILFLVLIFRVNLSAFILGFVLFTGIAYLLDPLFHWIGYHLLTMSFLKEIWTVLYNSTLCRIERFNNSILMGSLLFSLFVFIPLYIGLNLGILTYRGYVLEWVRKTRVMKVFMASKLYKAYESVSGWGGGF
ncbi:MAG: TIGR03546 family protein [Thermodesulfobacteriota bacterium]|nr:TIGR03546 family protein [Thermodesulfobacteriota bacterium]